MAKTGSRMTNQRQVICDYVEKHSLTHPTAEHVFEAVRKKLPRISFGTVYRNLMVLEQMGYVTPLYYFKDHVRYDGIVENHYHFVCIKCDKVENVSMDEMFELNKQISKRHGQSVIFHRIYFYGLCKDCQGL
ncbi:transcriptional repressor [Candidatus Falkowbacteria bacterium]|jgi:Fur family transcriptional regulator, peroxide stress response regulator|nr:transcriptional repressor [Candidatus Falkowbacteria bacterium]MBT5503814.1 transcriptional repressor [Candidatus Falkowbacteria bacterium]MBT6573861.1 transcriptional repressor [Candidatus Falkowbacteria bacterium]MBT7348551.1 transcriptional repressor [Candidatus Falkowbacteria bacterium]MBT7501065.1 transcriptional repressor [Candidatus Falkowbacteria bacterium]